MEKPKFKIWEYIKTIHNDICPIVWMRFSEKWEYLLPVKKWESNYFDWEYLTEWWDESSLNKLTEEDRKLYII